MQLHMHAELNSSAKCPPALPHADASAHLVRHASSGAVPDGTTTGTGCAGCAPSEGCAQRTLPGQSSRRGSSAATPRRLWRDAQLLVGTVGAARAQFSRLSCVCACVAVSPPLRGSFRSGAPKMLSSLPWAKTVRARSDYCNTPVVKDQCEPLLSLSRHAK